MDGAGAKAQAREREAKAKDLHDGETKEPIDQRLIASF